MWLLILEIFLLGVSLSMDAFAVSITDGMCYRKMNAGKAVTIPLTFGIFQAAMPAAGYFFGSLFADYIQSFDHYVAFGLLLIIGGKMVLDAIREARTVDKEEIREKKYSFGEVFVQGVATSIDALAVGISMHAMNGITAYNLIGYVSLIGATTFVISLIGLVIGVKIGKIFKNKAYFAELLGGLVLIGIGIKILVEGLI